VATARNLKRLRRIASKDRKMVARATKNMQVPAYWPAPFGVHAFENSGVVVEVKKVIAMSSMPIMLEDDMSMELVELAIVIPDIVDVGVSVMDIVMPFRFIAVNS
jgi:hypothetical protein